MLQDMQHYLIAVQGPNRTGMVAEVTGLLYRHGVNITDSSMTTLRSEFTMMLVVQLPESLSATSFEQALERLGDENMTISLRTLSAAEASMRTAETQPNYSLSVLGQDQTGMIYRFSELLASQGANLSDVHTQLLDGSHSPPLYAMILELHLPARQAELLQVAIDKLADEMGVDADLHTLEQIAL